MSGSATPRASTRFRMMSTAWSMVSSFSTGPLGCSTTETPPWRSRPRTGELPARKVQRRRPRVTTTKKMSAGTPLRRTEASVLLVPVRVVPRVPLDQLGDGAALDAHDHPVGDLELQDLAVDRDDGAV